MPIRVFAATLAAAALLCAATVPETAQFRSARPMWPEGLETEMNLLAGFRAVFEAPAGERVALRVAGSTLYRVFVNGRFRGHGPARGPHGFYRVDVWELTPYLGAGKNLVAIEVAGYNVNSYYVLNQPSFLRAEVFTGTRVLASTLGEGAPFEATILKERMRKAQRYSFQRAFAEVYRLAPGFDRWRSDPAAPFQPVRCVATAGKKLIPRGVPYPDFALRQPVKRVAGGEVRTGVEPAKLWKDRALTGIGPAYRGFREQDLEEIPSIDLQKIANASSRPIGRAYAWKDPLRLAPRSFEIFDFGTNLTGFLGVRVTARRPATLYLSFDETLTDGDVDFHRLGVVNIVTLHLAPGVYDFESFEPYTLRYLKATVLDGECDLERVSLREYANPDVWTASFASSDEGLNRLFAAGRETYRQNAVDIFMDCPSRERAGWLCDSYFTARVEHVLSGRPLVERNFLQNFLLPDKFEHLPEGMLPMCYPADHYNGTFIPNWSLWFVLQLEEYLDRSGDRELVDAFRPKVMRLLDYFRQFRNPDGLLEGLKSWVFIEWSAANQFTQDVNYPSNMLYAAALAAAGRLYAMPELGGQAERVRAAIRRQSFDDRFFVDNAVRKDGRLVPTRNRTETCQYYAFYLGTATPETHARLWQTLRDEFGPARKQKRLYPEIHEANSFIGNVLRLELLSRYGLTAQLAAESRDYLLYMADRTGTLWENVHAQASLNHGFASHVVNCLYRDILGLYRVDTVHKVVRVRFTDSPLEWCEGRVPVPGGGVSFGWRKRGGEVVYRLDVPAGYGIEIENRSRERVTSAR